MRFYICSGLIAGLWFGTATLATASTSAETWYQDGKKAAEQNAANFLQQVQKANRKAKNIILFVGDGMGVSTVTAARIYAGQKLGAPGEEYFLPFEKFPFSALAKTYNTNQQTPDSAGTMTAMMSGIKTKAGIIGVNQETVRGNCQSQKGNEVRTALEYAEIAGMSTGVVTTARITHATPAATYAHIFDRNFEDDRDATKFENTQGCADIASQLIEFPQRFQSQYPWVDGLEVALGGGRRSFIPRQEGADPEDGGQGERLDGRDLTREWTSKYSNASYVWNEKEFNDIDINKVDHLLGLFDMSHMEYNLDRATDSGGEPSLGAMTSKAISMLQKNPNGFFLHVESGRIDHAHHATNPKRALEDTMAFAEAVETAYRMTDPNETLIIVTADHSHVFTIAGYPTRGNPILGKVVGNDASGNPTTEVSLAADGLPYTTVGYTNGRGFAYLPEENSADSIYDTELNFLGRANLTDIDTTNKGYHPEVVVPLDSETHAAEDVAVYAVGPGSHMVSGVMEQNAIYHVMNLASDLELRAAKQEANLVFESK